MSGLTASVAAFMPVALGGCGGDEAAALPSFSVGATGQQISAGRVATVTASGPASSYVWTQIAGPTAQLTGGNTGTLTLLAPAVEQATPLEFRLEATNAQGQRALTTATVTVTPAELGFLAVPKSLADVVAVPEGYTVTVLYRLGDPLNASTPAYANNGTDTNFAARAGDHHDALYFFGLSAVSMRDDASSTRGLLAINHENITQRYLHPNGATSAGGVRPEAEAIKEMEARGVSVVEVQRASGNGAWSYIQNSALNRRVTPLTPTVLSGPAAGNPLLRTAFSPTGIAGRGTINNWGNGYTPLGDAADVRGELGGVFPATHRDRKSEPKREGADLARALWGGVEHGQLWLGDC